MTVWVGKAMGDDEFLVRYCLGDLDQSERDEIEARLRSDPAFAAHLAQIRECLQDVCRDDGPQPAEPRESPPESLASRTAAAVMAAPPYDGPDDNAVGLSPERGAGLSERRFSLVEVATVGVAALLLGMLILPAIQTGREASRRLVCANNLRQVGANLQQYSIENFRRYPPIGPGVHAGMFSVMLVDDGFVTAEQLERRLLCPSSWQAEEVRAGSHRVRIPSSEEVRLASDELVSLLMRQAAGSYAYRLGHLHKRAYWYPRDRGDSRAPVMADAPEYTLPTVLVSRNHGPCGENVLFQDGRVAFVTSCYSQSGVDHLFLNDAGQLAAGRRPADVVLAPGDVTPGVSGVVSIQY
ncbi:DUF1559 domain-containing protein [Botrimarina sp.]|uniref:DUF1559 family PulG-like putative transporter n=1 Tax=Botrimarina sp. TaxID=2795802 RepID=UPI0032F08D2B